MDTEIKSEAQPLHITPIVLAFVAGLSGAFMVEVIRTRFFPPENSVVYIKLKEFMGERIADYGSLNYESEAEQLYVARLFSETVEASLTAIQAKYRQPIFVAPAVVSGGMDLTFELEAMVDLVMSEHVDGVPKNELPKSE